MQQEAMRTHPAAEQPLRVALGQFATGVTIVTTLDAEGRKVGLTANSFTSVSLEPPLVLWNLSMRSANLPVFQAAPRFAISVLASGQHGLCRRFAQRMDGDRFDGVSCLTSPDGIPLIEGALATFECETHAQYEAGDHLVILGRVMRHSTNGGDALIFRAGQLVSSVNAVELH